MILPKLSLDLRLRLGGGASAPAEPAPAISLTVEGGAKAHNSTYDAGTPDEDDVVVLTVVATNSGNAELTLVNATDSGAVSAGVWDDTSIAPAGTATFDVTLDTSVAGAQTGYFEFTSNASPSPYRVNFEFEVIALVPVMAVTGNGVAITNGDATPDAADHTQFAATIFGTTVTRTYTILNTGSADLENIVVTPPAGFTLTNAPAGTIAASGSDTFTIRCDAGSVATLTGTVSIASNDSATPYTFDISCVVDYVQIIYDTFTGVNGTLLTAHTPEEDDPGGGWLTAVGAISLQIQSNKASQGGAATNTANVIESSDADATVKVNMTGRANLNAGVIFRYIDAQNYWKVDFGNTNWRLIEVALNVTSIRQTVAHGFAGGADHTVAMEVRLSGTSIEFLAEGVSKITFSSSVNQAGTKHGFLAPNNGSGVIHTFDDFEVYP